MAGIWAHATSAPRIAKYALIDLGQADGVLIVGA
jgi:hypothetical protein